MQITKVLAQEQLLEIRGKYGLTLEKVSEKTKVAKSTLIDIEKGRRSPGAITIFKLNRYFETLD